MEKKKNSVDYLCLPVTEQQQFLMLCHPRMRCIHSISTFYIKVYPSLEFQSSPRRYVVAWNVSLTNLYALNLISPVRQTRFDSSQPCARAPSLLSIDSFHRRKINVFTFSGIRWLAIFFLFYLPLFLSFIWEVSYFIFNSYPNQNKFSRST